MKDKELIQLIKSDKKLFIAAIENYELHVMLIMMGYDNITYKQAERVQQVIYKEFYKQD